MQYINRERNLHISLIIIFTIFFCEINAIFFAILFLFFRLFDSGESADDPQSAVALEMESAERRSEPDLLVYGGAILLILLVVSVLLFYVDKWATEKYSF